MNRRLVVVGVVSLPAAAFLFLARRPAITKAEPHQVQTDPNISKPATIQLDRSGPVATRHEWEVIENLDVDATFSSGITVAHPHVTVRKCRIRHAGGRGLNAINAPGLVLEDLEIDHVGAPQSGRAASREYNNVHLRNCPGAVISRVKASRGSSNIYLEDSPGAHLSYLELHDARGPEPRGQNVQFNKSPDSILEDFSAENGPMSWTEDNVSLFRSDRCVVRRGLVSYNNSPTGDGIMLEGSSDCLVEDVDALQQGNGAFAAVPEGDAVSGGCTFVRCRTAHSYNAPRDGRAAPSSHGLSFYMRISANAPKHSIKDCHHYALANPRNLIWDVRAVNLDWSFTRRMFTPRDPIRLAFAW